MSFVQSLTILAFNTINKIFIYLFIFFICPDFETANCIAVFWTGSPHSLGRYHFRNVWATCLSHKGGVVPLSALPKDTTSELAGLFSTTFLFLKCRAQSKETVDTSFLYSFGMTRQKGTNLRSTDCKADALTTT